jgi:hypothetical protein
MIRRSKMDIYNSGIGLLLLLGGVLIAAIQYRIGDFDQGAKITRNTIGLVFASVVAIASGIYFIVSSFGE